MFQRIDFTNEGGFPLTQNAMAFLQDSFGKVIEAMTYLGGQYIILTGVTQSSPNVYTNGWVIANGEILPFVGGIGQTNLSITQATSGVTFRDTTEKIAFYTRSIGFDVSGTIPFSNFKRLSLSSLKTYVDSVSAATSTAQSTANAALSAAGSFSAGMIMMWAGNPASVPTGWALCDGLDGRPNLKGKFVVGFSATTGTYTMGATGGLASVLLASNQMPLHTHAVNDPGHNHANGVYQYLLRSDGLSTVHDNDNTTGEPNLVQKGAIQSSGTGISLGNAGGNAAHENRPPYYTLAYIIKL